MSGHRDIENTNISDQTSTNTSHNYMLGEVYTPNVSNSLPERPVDQSVKVERTDNGVILDFSSPFTFDAVNTNTRGKTADGGRNALVVGKREFEQGLQKEFEGDGASIAQASILAGSKTEAIFKEFNTDGKVGLSRLEFDQARKSLGFDKQEVELTTKENQQTIQIKAPDGDIIQLNSDNITNSQNIKVTATDNNVTVKVADTSANQSLTAQDSADLRPQKVDEMEAFRWWDKGLTSQAGFAAHDGLSSVEYDKLVKRLAEDSPVKNVATDSEGSSTVTLKDGTSITRVASGATSIVGADGRSITIDADGTRRAIQANGNETFIRPDGSGYFTHNGELESFAAIPGQDNIQSDKSHDNQGGSQEDSDNALHFKTPFTFANLNTNHIGRKHDGTRNSKVIGGAEFARALEGALEESGLSPSASRLAANGAVGSIFREFNTDGKLGLSREEFAKAKIALGISPETPTGLPGTLNSDGQFNPGYKLDLGKKGTRQLQSW